MKYRPDRRAYFRWYDANKRNRPKQGNKAKPKLRYRCPLCGFLGYPGHFEREHGIELLFQYGNFTYAGIEEMGANAATQNILYAKLQDFSEHIARRCCSMLRYFIGLDVITQEEIISLIGLEPIKQTSRMLEALTLPASSGMAGSSKISGSGKIEQSGGFNYGSEMHEAQ
jgi:hypothetical protein